MKSFSLSTILGLTFGVLLAGYAVFAFTPPTVAPTGGNVLAPINVGANSQVKSGGLWVGSLGVDGGATFGGDIDASGNICVTGGKCVGELFDRVVTLEGSVLGVDTDGDGIADPADCAPSDSSKWQNLGCYIDNDGDGVNSSYTTTACSGFSCSGSTGSPGNDCAATDSSKWQTISDAVTDADHDSYSTAAVASSQCLGPSSVFNSRTYYINNAGSYTWCSNSVCSGGLDFNDANASVGIAPPPKVCSGNDWGANSIWKPQLEDACDVYCGGPGTTVTCPMASGEYHAGYSSIDWSTCTVLNYSLIGGYSTSCSWVWDMNEAGTCTCGN